MAQLKDLLMDEVLDALVKAAEDNASDRPLIEESIPKLSAHERGYCRKVCILLNKLRRKGVSYEWDGNSFVVERMMPSGYPMTGYLYVDWDSLWYAFDNDSKNLFCSSNVGEVLDYFRKWNAKWERVTK